MVGAYGVALQYFDCFFSIGDALEHRLAALATTPAAHLQRTIANRNANVTNSAERTEG